MRMVMAPRLAEERQEDGSEDIERGHSCRDDAYPIHPRMVVMSSQENLVFAVEARERRNSRDRYPRGENGPERNRNLLPKPAHVAQILFATQRVNDAASAEE